ncbi:MAG TPA: hypothetical protein VH092_24075, partial [Urbifossiella sp.]|nr:hypothetical protein [Urbifossiella sp.]
MTPTLSVDGYLAFVFLTDWEFNLGHLGWAGYSERCQTLEWLMDSDGAVSDPRADGEMAPCEVSPDDPMVRSAASSDDTTDVDDPLHSLIPNYLRQKWVFTKNDADFYPSV